ncbi:SAM-dependent methyltransferase [Phenylobacterium haematophilum]|uniref:SAM-dependent methyltransferase n=1 Tax=Phenylobacterium haematophilum TaxID=98513 RepID=A0A839ZTS5_9CAUL|nr:class I SAM-dependent methyltransferase [Phenylobacterium haematophilum]MBB3889384.1 SAM-dependent methyltransferase [Phenylobacterium haematophilum]
MPQAPSAPTDQAAYWNKTGGQAWVDLQDMMDNLNRPIEEALVERAFPGVGKRVLDIGCGAGATTLAMARRLGSEGLSLGVDISAPLIEIAVAQATAGAQFVQADAQTYDFDQATFDAAMSRFGVMFFSDFDAAFANIRRSLKPGAELVFACWRSPADNPMAVIPGRAAAPFLPPSPAADPLAPGRFAFADPERVRGILTRSGWSDIDITRLDTPTPIALDDLVTLSLRMGPVAAALREADEATRGKVREAVENALEAEAVDGVVPMVAGCWLVTARA